MTIAIGMLYNEGVLMCADSLVTTGTLGSYQSKILGYRVDGADVIFAMAGNVDLAESAWQQCRQVVLTHAGKKHTAKQIADSLRPVLAKEYQGNVVDTGWLPQNDYCFILAIRAEGAKAEIHSTYQKTLKASRRGMEHIGAGSDLSKFLMSWVPQPSSLSNERAADVLGYIVGTLKAQMPGTIGGSNLILMLSDDGQILFYTRSDLKLIELYSPVFERDARNLLWKFFDEYVTEQTFEEALGSFAKQTAYWRKQWKEKRDTTWSTPPDEAGEAIIDLRTVAQ